MKNIKKQMKLKQSQRHSAVARGYGPINYTRYGHKLTYSAMPIGTRVQSTEWFYPIDFELTVIQI